MIRFRPTVETLQERALPSAGIARPDLPAATPVTVTIDASGLDGIVAAHRNGTMTGKITPQDIPIVVTVSKSSP
jgi:hypothetical protein